ncbi:hypothetical protein ACFQ1I_30980 [Kitasatospora arboriphila]
MVRLQRPRCAGERRGVPPRAAGPWRQPPALDCFRAVVGRDPEIGPLLARRGLA